MYAVRELLEGLGTVLPHEAVVALLVAVLLLAVPGWWRGVRARQIRARVRAVTRAPDAETRRRAEDAALAECGGKVHLLVALAEEAQKLNRFPLAERAIDALEPLSPRDAARLRPKAPISPPPADPIEAVVLARRLAEDGLHDRARALVADARRRFPDDPELARLAAELGDAP